MGLKRGEYIRKEGKFFLTKDEAEAKPCRVFKEGKSTSSIQRVDCYLSKVIDQIHDSN